jgi:predicted enzyme related to lactoylglutathione lyase
MIKPSVASLEITGDDGPALQRLYSKLSDRSINDAGDGSGYELAGAGEKRIAGGIGASQDDAAGGATFHVEAGDPAGYLDRDGKPGGKSVAPHTEIPDSRLAFAFCADPEGHVAGFSRRALS